MGALSQVPFLAGYNEQDQINRGRETQGLQTLSQMMGLQNQQRQMRLQDLEMQKKTQQSQALEQWAMSQKDPEVQAMVRAMGPAALPYIMEKMKPQGPMMIPQGGALVDPRKPDAPLFTNPKEDPSPFGKVNPNEYTPASIAKFAQTKNYGDLVPQAKPSTHVNVAAPVTPVTIQDPKNPGQSLVIDGRTKQVLGVSPKLGDIPKADLKLSQSLPQAKLRTETMTQNLDKLDAALVALDKHPGLPYITGTIYGRTPSLRDDAIDAQAQLNSITSQIFQDSLQAMREASKTGGAVGNVSDREGDKLERTMGALDRAQTTESFQNQVKKVRQQIKQSTAIIKAAFKDQYDGVEPYRSHNATQPPAKGGVLRFDAQGNPI